MDQNKMWGEELQYMKPYQGPKSEDEGVKDQGPCIMFRLLTF